VSVAALMAAGAALAGAKDVELSIPPEDLRTALSDFSRATGVQMLVERNLVEGKRTEGVSGSYGIDQALSRLLRGTGLDFTIDGDKVFVKPAKPVNPAAAAPVATPVAATAAAAPGGSSDDQISEVVVTGFAASVSRSLEAKRAADNIIDVINAEDIGKFPSQNVAEAIEHIPGVTITRDRGEGLFVSIRGLPPDFAITTMNGRSMAVNEEVRNSLSNTSVTSEGRQFRFNTLPSELVAGVDVIKSPTADLDEGGMSGVVNIRTFRPLDIGKTTLEASVEGSYPQLADKLDPHVSGLFNWVNEDKSFGILVAPAYFERSMRQDEIWQSNWAQTKLNGASVLDSGGFRSELERQKDEHAGVNASLQWSPTDYFETSLDLMVTRLIQKYIDNDYNWNWTPGSEISSVVSNGVVTKGVAASSVQIETEEATMKHQNVQIGWNGKYHVDGWSVSGDVAYSRADSGTPNPIRRTRLLGSDGNVAFSVPSDSDSLPSVDFLTGSLTSTTAIPGRRLEYRTQNSADTENAGQLDIEHALDLGPFDDIQVGIKWRDREREYTYRNINVTAGLAGNYFPASFYDSFPVSNFLSGSGAGVPTTWLIPDTNAFWSKYFSSSLLNQPLLASDLRNSYEVREKIAAGYAMTKLSTSLFGLPLHGDIGVRVASTDETSSGHVANGSLAVPVSYEKNYTNVLPSANLVLDVTPELSLRASAAKVVTRPSLTDEAPAINVNSSGNIYTASGGNPNLAPYQAWQYDATAEWYFAHDSALIGDFFYKDIGTFIYNQLSPLAIDGITYTLTAPVNGGSAHIIGGEIAYQQLFRFLPDPWDGLGLLANVTFTGSGATYHDTTTGSTFQDAVSGVSRHSYNLTGFYEKGPIGLRATYSWTGNVLEQVGTYGYSDVNNSAFGTLNLNASYSIDDSLSFTAEAINALDEAQRQYTKGGAFAGYYHYGRTILFGARMKY
jgi:TonB-dependent receptor